MPDRRITWTPEELASIRRMVGSDTTLNELLALLDDKYHTVIDELHTSKERYRAILESQDDLVCRYTPDTVLTFVNEAYARYHNIPPEGLIGTSFLRLLPDENAQIARAVVDDMLANPRPMLNIFPTMKDGQQLWYQWSDIPIVDQRGEVIEIQTVGRDVTALKQLESEQVRLQVEREQRRLLTNFIRDASHEFRTPLTIIQSSTYIARKSQNLDKIYSRLDKINRQVEAITELVDALLLMTRLDNERPSQELFASDVQFTLRGVLENMADALGGRDVQVHWSRLPDILAHHSDIAIAFREIIDNAIAHTPEDGHITIALKHADAAIVIAFTDDGAGIPADKLPHIWQRFYRGDEARTLRGFGLGLAIVKRIVEMHNGDIGVTSEEGAGTTVTMRLPVRTAHKPD